MKTPQLGLFRSLKDAPLVLLFGVTVSETDVEGEWHYVRHPVRAGTILRHGKTRYRLPRLTQGLHQTPLRLKRA